MTRALDGATFALCLLAAICAENSPLMLALIAAAGVLVCIKESVTRDGRARSIN